MFKKMLFVFMIFCVSICLTSCKKAKTIILFNSNPITSKNLLDNANEFIAGKRFYYIFITQKPLKTEFIRVRVLKYDGKELRAAVKVVYSNDYKLKSNQIFYYNDYLVMGEDGDYCMVVYALNNLKTPLAAADFKIKK